MVKLVSYRTKEGTIAIGRVDSPSAASTDAGPATEEETGDEVVTPLLYADGMPVTNLHTLIAQWKTLGGLAGLKTGEPLKLSDVEILAPLRGRDVLCVGKNYKAHAAEFHNSGFDSSDTKAQPDYPVIFTKRATSIVPTGAQIYLHPKVTSTVDYEGELAIIVGEGGRAIKREDAWRHVWGATIVNDVTARERQRDHKQFYIGKSLDTFCPMGPYAVPSEDLSWPTMHLTTRVNGSVRQSQATNELIFDVPTLIETCSLGITLRPGDVICTGTPVGVCLSTGVYLQKGDRVDVSISGIGTLSNVVGDEEPVVVDYE